MFAVPIGEDIKMSSRRSSSLLFRWLFIGVLYMFSFTLFLWHVVEPSSARVRPSRAIIHELTETIAPHVVKLTEEQTALEEKLEAAVGAASRGRGGFSGWREPIQEAMEDFDDAMHSFAKVWPSTASQVRTEFRRVEIHIVAELAHAWHAEHAKKRGKRFAGVDRNAGFAEREDDANDVDDHPGPAYVPEADPTAKLSEEDQNAARRSAVVDTFKESWAVYSKFAWGCDEVKPVSRKCMNWSDTGLGLTILDAMTTMHLMGLDAELDRALRFVEDELDFDVDGDYPHFELTIRGLGGILSIYELTGEKRKKLLAKAQALGDRLIPAYDTPIGIPDTSVNLRRGNHSNPDWREGCTALSEAGSVQLEMRALSFHTNKSLYNSVATRAHDSLRRHVPKDRVPRLFVNVTDGSYPLDKVAFGALGDSYYEYLLKLYLMTNRTDLKHKLHFKDAVKYFEEQLLQYSSNGDEERLAFIAQRHVEHHKAQLDLRMEHLACFFPGSLFLGAEELHKSSLEYDRWRDTARELVDTCVAMYRKQQSGVAPEAVVFPQGEGMVNGDGYYVLRPETLEALYYAWRFTKEQKYRDIGWELFRNIRRFTHVPTGGHSGVKHVNVASPEFDDAMQTFWFAETLKYAFLLFSDDATLDIGSEWVLNTEGHPLRVREWDPLSMDDSDA